MTRFQMGIGYDTVHRPVLMMLDDCSMVWSTLGEIVTLAYVNRGKVVCHKSAVVGDYVTIEPTHTQRIG